jgi:DNA-binding MarR family transcriptional regulator
MGNTPEYDDDAPGVGRHRWIGAPDWDQSPGADFRRQVADILREVEEKFRSGGTGDASGNGSGPVERKPEAAEGFEVRSGTPYLLFRLMTLLGDRLGPTPPLEDLVLLDVARSGSTLGSALRRRYGVPRATLTGVIQRLEGRGLVESGPHWENRRHRRVVITGAGLRAAAARADRWRGADEALLEWITPAERDELRRLLRKGVTAMKGAR